MTTFTVLYGTPTDPEAFRTHYEQVHVPLALALPGATNARWSLTVETLAGEPVFAMFQADFTSREALDAALASPEGAAAQADVPSFATGSVTILVS
jgi:uncharacterized protein (TIGR02118 family)